LVGGPIDVLTLDAEGAHWDFVKGGTCSHEEKESQNGRKAKEKLKRNAKQAVTDATVSP
jgi:uncharacterized membrane protein